VSAPRPPSGSGAHTGGPLEPIQGRVATGAGEAQDFTALAWVREQLIDAAGIEPCPGTLNLELDAPAARARWRRWCASLPARLIPPDPTWCSAGAAPVRIGGRIPGAVVVPAVPDYPAHRLELVSALRLRDALALADGDRLYVQLCAPLPVRGVIFDLDGTLVDALDAYRRVAQQAAAACGLTVTDAHLRAALSTPHTDLWDLVVPATHPRHQWLRRELHRIAVRATPAIVAAHTRLFPGVGQTLAALAGRGLRLGIVTGSKGRTLALLEAAGLMTLVGATVTAADVDRPKPDPQGLARCAEQLGLAPAEIVYVGDGVLDVLAARAAGMFAVAVLSGAGDCAALAAAGPDRIVRDHRHLAQVVNARA